MHSISRKGGNHDPVPLHGTAPIRSLRLDCLRSHHEKRAAGTIPLWRFRVFIFSRRRLRRRLDHVPAAAVNRIGDGAPSPKAYIQEGSIKDLGGGSQASSRASSGGGPQGHVIFPIFRRSATPHRPQSDERTADPTPAHESESR